MQVLGRVLKEVDGLREESLYGATQAGRDLCCSFRQQHGSLPVVVWGIGTRKEVGQESTSDRHCISQLALRVFRFDTEEEVCHVETHA